MWVFTLWGRNISQTMKRFYTATKLLNLQFGMVDKRNKQFGVFLLYVKGCIRL